MQFNEEKKIKIKNLFVSLKVILSLTPGFTDY